MQFTVRLSPPLGASDSGPTLAPLLLDSGTTSIQWQTAWPGGTASISIGIPSAGSGLPPGILPQPGDIPPYAHVGLYAGADLVAEGQLVEFARDGGGEIIGFIAEGYPFAGLSDATFYSTNSSPQPVGTLIGYVTQQLAPYLRLGSIIDPGTTHSYADFDAKDLGQILDQLAKEGDGSGTLYDVSVSLTPNANPQASPTPTLNFQPRSVPAVPDYDLLTTDGISSWKENLRNLRGQVQVRYGSPAVTTAPVTNALFTGQYRRQRSVLLQGGSLPSAAAAANYAATYLSLHGQPEVAIDLSQQVGQGEALELMPGLRRWGGGQVPPWLVTSGQWARVSGKGPYLITRTSFDADTGAFSAKLGDWWSDSVDAFTSLHRGLLALKRGVNPLTGA